MVERGARFEVVALAPSCLALVGELDLAGMPELEMRLAACNGDAVLDCSGLTFVSAAALSLFARMREECEVRGVRFRVVAPSDCLVRVLALTGLEGVFLTEWTDRADERVAG